jgi:hypothetical protein
MGATHLGYGIFVRFRRSRLPLRRDIAKLEDALAIAEQIRAERFHKREAVFVVKEPEGTVVTAGSAEVPQEELSAASTAAPSPLPPSPLPPAPRLPSAVAPLSLPPGSPLPFSSSVPPAPPALPAARTALDPAALHRWTERLRAMQWALKRARRAQARLESAHDAAGSVLRLHGSTPPEAWVRHHEALGRVCDSVRRTVASFERTAAMVERHLQGKGAALPSGRAGV